jgi:plastocyanin
LVHIPIEARAGFPPIMVDAVGNLVRFTPEAVIVAPGTTVTWIVRDLGSPEDNLIIIRALDDGSDAVSPELKRGDRFAFTFARPGSYPFTFPKNPSEQGANVVVVLSH